MFGKDRTDSKNNRVGLFTWETVVGCCVYYGPPIFFILSFYKRPREFL